MSTVLITGASRGIGRASAVALTTRGHRVVATARDVDDLADLDVAHRVALDVTDDASVRAAVDEAGAIDVLVNNAGVGMFGPVESAPPDVLARLFDVNVVGPARTTAGFLPGMRERGSGLVVNVSSGLGVVPLPLNGIYAASKAALEAMSQALRLELLGTGVGVVLVVPGLVATEAGERSWVHVDDSVEHYRRLVAAAAGGGVTPMPVDEAAATVVEAVESGGHGPFRRAVGADARQLLAARRELDDEALLASVAGMFGLPVAGGPDVG